MRSLLEGLNNMKEEIQDIATHRNYVGGWLQDPVRKYFSVVTNGAGGLARHFTNPMPDASDNEILRLYQTKYNRYATPEALRDIERGVQMYFDNNPRSWMPIDKLRDDGLKSRGLRYNQTFDEIPERSPTGRLLRGIINLPSTWDDIGA